MKNFDTFFLGDAPQLRSVERYMLSLGGAPVCDTSSQVTRWEVVGDASVWISPETAATYYKLRQEPPPF